MGRLEGLEQLKDRIERWGLWGLGLAAAVGAIAGGVTMLVMQLRARPDRWSRPHLRVLENDPT